MVVGVERTSTSSLHQVVGHTVVVRVESDVIVDVDSGTGPFAKGDLESVRQGR